MLSEAQSVRREVATLRERALSLDRRIVLVDGANTRVIEGTGYVQRNGSIRPILVGDRDLIKERLGSRPSAEIPKLPTRRDIEELFVCEDTTAGCFWA